MAKTDDFKTEFVAGALLESHDVLVGESGGLSAVYRVGGVLEPDAEYPGCLILETEHGTLLVNPHENYRVLDSGQFWLDS